MKKSLTAWFESFFYWLQSMEGTRREILFASIFLVLLLLIGTQGYHLIEGWPLLDGLYMTFITLTTIGFGEVHPLSNAGRIFTMVISIFGIGTVAFIATRATQLLINNPAFQVRRMIKRIEKTHNHYIICGYGRIGRRIAEDLHRTQRPFVLIENNEEKIEEIRQRRFLYVQGNAEEEETLLLAGIKRASGLIVTLPLDSDNVFVTLMARDLNPQLFILARANTQQNFRKLLRAGANKVISPYEIGADWMAQVILRPHVDYFMEQVLRTHDMNLLIDEVYVNSHSPIAHKSLAESGIRQRYNVIVIAIVETTTGNMVFNPSADTVIKPGDVLIVLGEHEKIEQLKHECVHKTEV